MRFCLSILLLIASISHADITCTSWFDKKENEIPLIEHFLEAGVPEDALVRTFDFLDLIENADIEVSTNNKVSKKRLSNKNYAIIIDYSKPSSERRLYLLNLQTGETQKYFVAHGMNSGGDLPMSFSNKVGSLQSSLGFYLTGSTYIGKHGESLILYGLDASNSRALERNIVIHGAHYVSMDFLASNGRMGRSWGCPAVSRAINRKLLPLIKNGALIFAYHKDLMTMTETSPSIQNVGSN